MTGGVLARFVDVVDEHGVSHSFGPGQTVPTELAHLVSNPDVWALGPGVGVTPGPGVEAAMEDIRSVAPTPHAGSGDVVERGEPPRYGKGSGLDAWRDFAEGLGIATEGLDRGEIIAAVEQLDGEDVD